jgi:hypothetical protein
MKWNSELLAFILPFDPFSGTFDIDQLGVRSATESAYRFTSNSGVLGSIFGVSPSTPFRFLP